jgi:hypothetical protein
LANVHLLALALQGGIDPQKLVIDGGEEFVVEDEEGIEEDV